MTQVQFQCSEHLLDAIPHPVAASRAIPTWYKSLKPFQSEDPSSSTAKRCLPFVEALSQGFIISLWADLYVKAENGQLSMNFPSTLPMLKSLEQHSAPQLAGHPLENKPYGDVLVKFVNPWLVKTEPGYSCLFTSPLNHIETRFKILDGVVDTDIYTAPVNFPFLWTGGDGHFTIPKGTPLAQVIPIRRETHDLTVTPSDQSEIDRTYAILGTYHKDGYRKHFWHGRADDAASGA
jgi:hypothetical protein